MWLCNELTLINNTKSFRQKYSPLIKDDTIQLVSTEIFDTCYTIKYLRHQNCLVPRLAVAKNKKNNN